MKRTLLILSLSISAAAATEEDFSKADPGTYSDVPYIRHEGHEDEALPAAYVQQRLEVLKGVHDTLSAKAAVSILRTLHPKSASAETASAPINVLQMGMAAELTRLRDAHFYGATALAEYLNYSAALLIWVLIFVGFYFILIRPQSKRQKALQKMQSELKVGDSVYTTSGIVGKIVSLDETTVTLQVSEGTRIPFLRAAVSALVNAPEKK